MVLYPLSAAKLILRWNRRQTIHWNRQREPEPIRSPYHDGKTGVASAELAVLLYRPRLAYYLLERCMRAWIVWSFCLWLGLGMQAAAQAATENQNLTPAEQAYLAFAKLEKAHFGQDDQASVPARAYDTRFTPMQSPHSLAQASDRDVAALFRASSSVSFYAPSASHLTDLRHDFAELEKRGMATDEQRQDVFQALFQSRDFTEMQRFAASHPNAGLPPPVTSDPAFSPGQMHSLLSVTGPHPVHPSVAVTPSGPFVVVISHPGCHFTQHAIQAIEDDEALRAMIKDHSL